MTDIHRLLANLDASPCNFLAVKRICTLLENAGFKPLDPASQWTLAPGDRRFVVKNGTAVFAFIAGRGDVRDHGYRIISSHSDSPCFKLKPNAEIYNQAEGTLSLNVEKYGGAIMYTWFDRPLSMAGRVMIKSGDPMHPHTVLVDFRRPLCTVPHLAIHFNRNVNDGNKLSVQKDMKPVIAFMDADEYKSYRDRGGLIRCLLAEEAGVGPEDILDWELCLYPVAQGTLTGLHGEMVQSPRLDDLEMAFASIDAITALASRIDADPSALPEATAVVAIFDNEETGSGTKQGAASPSLANTLGRITSVWGADVQALPRAVENSFMVSADNAHGWHPNYTEKYDPTNHPVLNGGPVIKINANCKYMTDADGAAVFRAICNEAGVPCQYFVNHADVAGGSTLGNILTGQLDLRGVDMGCAVWAMHSAVETGGAEDYKYTVKAFKAFFSC